MWVSAVDSALTLNLNGVCCDVFGELRGSFNFQDKNSVDNVIANFILQSFFFHFISCRGLNSDKVGLTCVLFIVLLYLVYRHVNNITEAHLYNVMIPTCVIVKYLPITMYIYWVVWAPQKFQWSI